MVTALFLVRFTPFWSIPMLVIGFEFAYLFWVRKKKKRMLGFLLMGTFSFIMTVFYYWAGGPEKSVDLIMQAMRFYTE